MWTIITIWLVLSFIWGSMLGKFLSTMTRPED